MTSQDAKFPMTVEAELTGELVTITLQEGNVTCVVIIYKLFALQRLAGHLWRG